MKKICINTSTREALIPISQYIQTAIAENQWTDGLIFIFCPHTTASITINESADPDVQSDITHFLHTTIPQHAGFFHAEGNSDAHIKSSLFSNQLFVIVNKGKVMLGTWQEVYFCEWDGPRSREIWLAFLPR